MYCRYKRRHVATIRTVTRPWLQATSGHNYARDTWRRFFLNPPRQHRDRDVRSLTQAQAGPGMLSCGVNGQVQFVGRLVVKELPTSSSFTSSSSLSTLQVIVTTRSSLRGIRTRSLAPVRMRSRVIINLKRRNTRQLATLQTQAHYLMSTVGNTSSKVEPDAEFPRGPVPSPHLEKLCPSVVGVLISL